MDGDPTTGYAGRPDADVPRRRRQVRQYRIGGTSLSCPLLAGIEALADQPAGHAHGFANPAIYELAGTARVA